MRLNFYTLIFLLIIISTNTYSTNYTWTGATNTAWGTSTNWSPTGVPGTTDQATIPSTTNQPVLSANIRIAKLGMNGGKLNLSGDTLQADSLGSLTGGTITNGQLIIRGTVVTFSGTILDCKVHVICNQVKFNGSRFKKYLYAEQSGTASSSGQGGNVFEDSVVLKNSSTAGYFYLAIAAPDTFKGKLTVINTGALPIRLSDGATSYYQDNIVLNSTSGGIAFSLFAGSGASILSSGKTITIGSSGFSSGNLTLRNLTQLGGTSQNSALTGSSVFNLISSTFNGSVNYSAPSIIGKSCTFNGASTFTKSNTSTSQWDGGNTFNAAATFVNAATTSAALRLGATTGDIFNSDVTFNTTTGQIHPCYGDTTYFYGNISINSSLVQFNHNIGVSTFSGANNQVIGGTSSYLFGKIKLNKNEGNVTLLQPITVDSLLILSGRKIVTTSTNLITLKSGCIASKTAGNSFIDGPCKKIGNTIFTFPIGDSIYYRPLIIGAATLTTDAYKAEFIYDTLSNIGTYDSLATSPIQGGYWQFNKLNGSTNVTVGLGWDSSYVGHNSYSGFKICYLDTSRWKGISAVTVAGNSTIGTVTTTTAFTKYGSLGISVLDCFLDGTITYPSGDGSSSTTTSSWGSSFGVGPPSFSMCEGGSFTITLNDPCMDFSCIAQPGVSGSAQQFPMPSLTLTIALNIPGTYTFGMNNYNSPANLALVPFQNLGNQFTVTVLSPPIISFTQNVACNTGNITLCALPASLNYVWSNSATTQCISVPTGTYTVTVTNTAGCSTTSSQAIVTSPPISATLTPHIDPCVPLASYVHIDVTGGTAPFSVQWGLVGGAMSNGVGYSASFNTGCSISGAYTMTITDAQGCTTTLNWNVLTTNVTLTASSTYVCGAGTTSLNASGLPSGGTYLWATSTTGTTISCTTCSTTTAAMSVTSNLTINYTINGCTVGQTLQSLDVTPPNIPIVTAPINNCITGTLTSSVVNIQSGVTYTWLATYPGGSSTGTGTSMTINTSWPSPVLITFTAHNPTYPECIASGSSTYYGICTADVYHYVAPGINKYINLDFSNGFWSNLIADLDLNAIGVVKYNPLTSTEGFTSFLGGVQYTIAINCEFTVDVDMDMNHLDLVLGPNAKIIVNPGIRLLIGESTHIHSCGNYMWDRIVANSNGTNASTGIEEYSGRPLIEEGQVAFDIILPAYAKTFLGAELNRNLVGIYIHNPFNITPTSTVINNFKLSNSWYRCQGISGGFIGVAPCLTTRSSKGIQIEDFPQSGSTVLNIGSDVAADLINTFDNMDIAIDIKNSDVRIVHNDISNLDGSFPLMTPAGIALNIKNNLYAGTVSIGANIPDDLYRRYSNTITNVRRGLYSSLSGGAVTVYRNRFLFCSVAGIESRQCVNQSLTISRNTFAHNNIAVNTVNASTASGLLDINNNSITMTRTQVPNNASLSNYTGLRISQSGSANNPRVTIGPDNSLDGQFQFGMKLTSLNTASVFDNHINLRTISPASPETGINLNNCINNSIDGNGIEYIYPTATTAVAINTTAIDLAYTELTAVLNNGIYGTDKGLRVFVSRQGTQINCNEFNRLNDGVLNDGSDLGVQGTPASSSGNQWLTSPGVITGIVGINSHTPMHPWYVNPNSSPYIPTSINPAIPGLYPAVFTTATAAGSCLTVHCPGCRYSNLSTNFLQNTYDTLPINEMDWNRFLAVNSFMNDSIMYADSITTYDSLIFHNQVDSLHNTSLGSLIDLANRVSTCPSLDSVENLLDHLNSLPSTETQFEADLLSSLYYQIINLGGITDNSDVLDWASSNSYEAGPASFVSQNLCYLEGINEFSSSSRSHYIERSDEVSKSPSPLIFPNPSSGAFNWVSKEIISNLTVYNMLGEEIISEMPNSTMGQFILNRRQNTPGIYSIKFDMNGTIYSQKIVLSE